MKDKHTYGKKMTRNGRTKDIYKGTFVCIQTLQLIGTCFFYPFKNTNEAYTATLMSDLTNYMSTDIWGTLDTEIVRFVDNLQI